ncbi:MAG: flagellar motor protein MotB [Limnochordales bacterium]|nr:flagellar motor protein MotB [Limnochordales bacterium]
MERSGWSNLGHADRSEHSGSSHDGGGGLRWLLTYADLITLLMAFFIIMYAMSRLDLQKYQKLAHSLYMTLGGGGSGLGGPGGGGGGGGTGAGYGSGTAPAPEMSGTAQLDARWQYLTSRLERVARHLQASGLVHIRVADEGLAVVVSDQVLFASARAELEPEARQFLQQLAPVLKTIPNAIQIRGHTDDRPIQTREFPSNWELSLARAVNVLRFLAEHGVPGERLSAAGFGPTQPVASNDTPEGRARNRRVEIVILQLPAGDETTASGQD